MAKGRHSIDAKKDDPHSTLVLPSGSPKGEGKHRAPDPHDPTLAERIVNATLFREKR